MLFPTVHDGIATCVRKGHFDAANRLLQEHYHVTYEQPSATCYHIGDLGNRDRHAQYVGVSNLARKLGLLSVMEYDEENYLTVNVYGEKTASKSLSGDYRASVTSNGSHTGSRKLLKTSGVTRAKTTLSATSTAWPPTSQTRPTSQTWEASACTTGTWMSTSQKTATTGADDQPPHDKWRKTALPFVASDSAVRGWLSPFRCWYHRNSHHGNVEELAKA